MTIVKHEVFNNEYISVLIDTTIGKLWMDVNVKEETADWNQYIFFLNNSNDIEVKNFQEDSENYCECSSIALDYVEQLLKGVNV